jgi:regulator of sirC expression with transglutaminase-like and TPR domain
VEATERFAALVTSREPDLPLDEAALLIAAHAHPGLDVAARLRELDDLAREAGASDADALAHFLFRERGFTGNSVDYQDPRNSLLDDVLDRRLGIPISLSVLMIEIGRRRGIVLHGIGMPGHFLVGADGASYYDPFGGGARLDAAACVDRYAQTQPRESFRPEYLAPVGPVAIVERMLANLQHSYLARTPSCAAWPVRLRLLIPDRPFPVRLELAGVLARLGRFPEAAAVVDAVADEMSGERGERLRRQATRIRARAN